MREYDILEGLSFVDDIFISRARKKSSHKALAGALSTVAACLIILLLIPSMFNIFGGGNDNSPVYTPPSNELPTGNTSPPHASQKPDVFYSSHHPVTSDKGKITLTEHNAEEKTITFIFEKLDDSYLGFVFTGYDGKQFYNIITPNEYFTPYPEDAVIIDDKLEYTVNGVTSCEPPRLAGRYEITVDYSRAYEFCGNIAPEVLVVGFGVFKFK